MKYFLTLWLIVFSVLCLFAAHPRPPAGYAYETDLRPHSLVLTNAAAAGLANRSDIASATNALKSDMASALKPTAIYTPDGNTWTDATGCVWRVDRKDRWVMTSWEDTNFEIELDPITKEGSWAGYLFGITYYEDEYEHRWTGWTTMPWAENDYYYAGGDANSTIIGQSNTFMAHCTIVYTTNLVTRVAYTNDLANLTTTIPTIVTNVVRDVQGLVYDEKLGITWKQTMHDGNLYYIAVTNANITEVQ